MRYTWARLLVIMCVCVCVFIVTVDKLHCLHDGRTTYDIRRIRLDRRSSKIAGEKERYADWTVTECGTVGSEYVGDV